MKMKIPQVQTKADAYREKLVALKVGESIEVANKTEWRTLYTLVTNMNRDKTSAWKVTSRTDVLTGQVQYMGWRIK